MVSQPLGADASTPKEDAATAAAREELKQTVISEEGPSRSTMVHSGCADKEKHNGNLTSDLVADGDSNADSLECEGDTGFVSKGGPKKKRAHDQVDNDHDEEDSDGHSDSSAGSRDRATRLEPEKKRARDEATEAQKSNNEKALVKETTPSAFATSGFAKLSASTSPFGSLGASQSSIFASTAPLSPPVAQSTSFSSTAQSTSPFGSLTGAKSSGFGGGGFSGGGAFGSTGFGSLTGFSTLSASGPLSTFATASSGFKSEKPAKPFGAPESDVDDEDAEDESDAHSGSEEESNEKTVDKEKEDEKRKPRLQKVDVDDGEKGEATVLAVRAKLFYLNKDIGGWKERGAGMLKVNVPEDCVEFDNDGTPIFGSFDATQMEKGRVPRLILRQDQTHRVLLNTAILTKADFQEKTTLRATHVLFTALEGEDAKPVSITAKMSAANAKLFLSELDSIQKALREI